MDSSSILILLRSRTIPKHLTLSSKVTRKYSLKSNDWIQKKWLWSFCVLKLLLLLFLFLCRTYCLLIILLSFIDGCYVRACVCVCVRIWVLCMLFCYTCCCFVPRCCSQMLLITFIFIVFCLSLSLSLYLSICLTVCLYLSLSILF